MRYFAHFQPEAWQRDFAVHVDDEGSDTWDCTAFVATMTDEERDLINARNEFDPYLDVSDLLMEDPARPDWIKKWRGPFTITVWPSS